MAENTGNKPSLGNPVFNYGHGKFEAMKQAEDKYNLCAPWRYGFAGDILNGDYDYAQGKD